MGQELCFIGIVSLNLVNNQRFFNPHFTDEEMEMETLRG